MSENRFGWLKEAFLKSNVETEPQVGTPTLQAIPGLQNFKGVVRTQPTPDSVPVVNDGELDDQYINHLSDFMTKNNLPGPDYLEFARSLDEMINEMDGASEEKIFKMTYKVGYKQNLPVPKLVETANAYLGLFNQHKKEFNDYLDSESQKTIGTKLDENKRLTAAKTDAEKKIAELQAQVSKLQSDMLASDQKISENTLYVETETQKLTSKKMKFENAFNFVVGKVTDDIQKINLYLKDIQ